MQLIPDDPIIQSMERTGYPPWHRNDVPICPVCDKEAERFYKDINGEIVGCNDCIRELDAWDCLNENY